MDELEDGILSPYGRQDGINILISESRRGGGVARAEFLTKLVTNFILTDGFYLSNVIFIIKPGKKTRSLVAVCFAFKVAAAV